MAHVHCGTCATSGMVGARERQHRASCMRMQADACADRHTDACANIDSYALADFNAHACADVHVRACFACAISCTLWAHGHARTGMHDGAC